MTPHSTYDAFMLDHAAGNHSPAMALAADMHTMLNTKGHDIDHLWSIIGGVLLEAGAPKIDVPMRAQSDHGHSGETAATLIAQAENGLEWKRGLSGVQYAKAQTKGAKFMKLAPGESAPEHAHSALEATIVLQGRFTDGHGVYERGDIVFGEPGVKHKPAAYGDEECICFVAQDPRKFWRLT